MRVSPDEGELREELQETTKTLEGWEGARRRPPRALIPCRCRNRGGEGRPTVDAVADRAWRAR